MITRFCNVCGLDEHYHITPLVRGRPCDLDFRCWPKEQHEEIQLRVENYQLKKLGRRYLAALEKIATMSGWCASTQCAGKSEIAREALKEKE